MGTVSAKRFAMLRDTMITLAALGGLACGDTHGPFHAAGQAAPSALEEERFVMRLHLDLTGQKPDAATVTTALERLSREGNTADTRAAIAADLVTTDAFAELWVEDIETDAFGGARREDVYDLFCSVFLTIEPSCEACVFDGVDFCACDCDTVRDLYAEREALRALPADLQTGAASVDVDRRIASSLAFQFNGGSGEGIAAALFDAFLGRPPEPEEIRNVRALVLGDGIPNMAGLLFHRSGRDYGDLVDIVFDSEPYRDAAVNRVFFRYLGRFATPAELTHFSGGLDREAPDVRHLVVSVASSREYFEQ